MECEIEKIANKVKLCSYIKVLGKCESKTCRKRHLLSKELDTIANESYSGLINFKITKVIDVNVYCVNILEYTDSDGETKKNIHNVSAIETSLTEVINKKQYYADDVEIGGWFAFGDTDDDGTVVYRRCEVNKIIETDQITGKARYVKVTLVDNGSKCEVNICELFLLPEEFKNIPAQGMCFKSVRAGVSCQNVVSFRYSVSGVSFCSAMYYYCSTEFLTFIRVL